MEQEWQANPYGIEGFRNICWTPHRTVPNYADKSGSLGNRQVSHVVRQRLLED